MALRAAEGLSVPRRGCRAALINHTHTHTLLDLSNLRSEFSGVNYF